MISGRGNLDWKKTCSLTLAVIEVVGCSIKNLQSAGKVQKVELVLNGKEDVNGLLVGDGGGLGCTHLDGWLVWCLEK